MNYLDKTGLTHLWSKITSKLGQKQDTLVSGTNIKTINNTSLLDSGNIDTNEYQFCTEGEFWYLFKGVTSLDGITATIDDTEVSILQLLREMLYDPNEMQYLIDEIISALKEFKIPSSAYIDSTTSEYLWVDIKGNDRHSGTIKLRIKQINNEYVFTELEVWGSDNVFHYYVDDFDVSPVEFNVVYDISKKQNKLISGENIKTINNQSLLGSGNIDVQTDLTDYVKNTDYATTDTAGVIKTNASYGLQIATGGYIAGTRKTFSEYSNGSPSLVISKNILENVITGKNLETANNKVTSISSSSTDTQYPSAKCVYDNLQLKQNSLVSGTNIKTINNQNILGSGNISVEAEIGTNVEQKHVYNFENIPFFYQFYGVSSIDNITVNVGVEVDVIYATLVLINQTVEELQESYAPTLSAIQGIHIPNDAYETSTMVIAIHNLGCMTCYIDPTTKYVTQAIFTNFEQGYSVNFGENPNALTIYYSALNSTDYLSKTNNIPYTPTGDYQPATKKYVEDYIQSLDASEVSY